MSVPATEVEKTRPSKPCQRFEGHTNLVHGVRHLPGGQQIITCSDDGSLRVWSLQTGKQIAILQDGGSPVYSIALSVDGKKVVSGSGDGIVRLWSIETGKVIGRWTEHTSSVWSVCWNHDGEQILSGSSDGTARMRDVETGETILQINTGITHVYTATCSPNSTFIATGGYTSLDPATDERIKIWDATGKLIAILKEHTASVRCLAWTANGRTLISGSFDETIMTWDTSTWQQVAVLTGHTNIVYGIAISPNNYILASASWDETARLWNLDTGRPIGSPLRHPYHVNGVSFSTDGALLATGCYDHNAYMWDIPAITKEASLEKLPDVDKSFPRADATPHLVQEPEVASQLSEGFSVSIENPNVPDCDPDIPLPISSPVVPEGTSSISLHAIIPEDASPVKLVPPAVDVPSNQDQRRNYSAGQERARQKSEEEDERQAKRAKKSKNPNNAATTSQLHSPGNITQPADQSHARPSSEPHLATSCTTLANATSASATKSAIPVPDAIPLQAGCWTRFLLRFWCVSTPRHS